MSERPGCCRPRILMHCHRGPRRSATAAGSRVLLLACRALGHLPCRCAHDLAAIRQGGGARADSLDEGKSWVSLRGRPAAGKPGWLPTGAGSLDAVSPSIGLAAGSLLQGRALLP